MDRRISNLNKLTMTNLIDGEKLIEWIETILSAESKLGASDEVIKALLSVKYKIESLSQPLSESEIRENYFEVAINNELIKLKMLLAKKEEEIEELRNEIDKYYSGVESLKQQLSELKQSNEGKFICENCNDAIVTREGDWCDKCLNKEKQDEED